MAQLNELFPNYSFYGKGRPDNIITDDSLAECEGLQRTWPVSTLYLCVFHFLQSMWRWLLSNDNKIDEDHRQTLMELVRKLVYAKTETELNDNYNLFKQNPVTKIYNFINRTRDVKNA